MSRLRTFQIQICDACLNSRGEMCDTPGCVLIWLTTEEIEEYLSKFLIRPRFEGRLLFEEILGEVSQ